MPNDNRVLAMLPSLTLEQAEAVEAYVRDVDDAMDRQRYDDEAEIARVAEEARLAANEAAVLRLQVADLQRALSLANIKLGGIAMLLQGK